MASIHAEKLAKKIEEVIFHVEHPWCQRALHLLALQFAAEPAISRKVKPERKENMRAHDWRHLAGRHFREPKRKIRRPRHQKNNDIDIFMCVIPF